LHSLVPAIFSFALLFLRLDDIDTSLPLLALGSVMTTFSGTFSGMMHLRSCPRHRVNGFFFHIGFLFGYIGCCTKGFWRFVIAGWAVRSVEIPPCFFFGSAMLMRESWVGGSGEGTGVALYKTSQDRIR
jgi:hypothetical protein